MARITCPKCGAVADDLSQRFCTSCGAELPAPQCPAGKRARIRNLAYAGAGVVLLVIIAAVLWPGLMHAIPGTASAGHTGNKLAQPAGGSGLTLVPTETPVTDARVATTTAPVATTAAAPPTTTVPPATTVPVSTTVLTTRTTTTTEQTTVVVTETPAPTSQITLAVTHTPAQPPAGSATSTTPGAPYIEPSALEARIHELINVQRRQNGLSTLSYDPFLADIARGHSYDMVLRDFFAHENPDGLDQKARGDAAGYPCIRAYDTYIIEGISENLYQGYRYDTYLTAPNGTIVEYRWNSVDFIANQAVNGWMNSEGHRKNILDFHFRQEGIGVAFSADDRIFVTENFC